MMPRTVVACRRCLVGLFLAVDLECVGVGLPLAAVSFFQARKRDQPLGKPIAGLATTIVALFITIGWIVVVAITAENI